MNARSERVRLPRSTNAPRAARAFVRELQSRWNLSAETHDTCQLLVSELVSNAVLHGSGDVSVLVMECAHDGVRVEVRNQGAGLPVMRDARREDLSGRGLRLVDELAAHWGIDARDGSTLVWFETHPRLS